MSSFNINDHNREIPMEEQYREADAFSRMFPDPKSSYLRSALMASTILNVAKDLTPRDREYYERVKAVNIALYIKAKAL